MEADFCMFDQIFELQSAALRRALNDGHEYEFVEAPHPCSPPEGFASIMKPTEHSSTTWIPDPTDHAAVQQVVNDLDEYVEAEGPFDAVMGFSQGAQMAANYMVYKATRQQHMRPPFKCAVFFSAAPAGWLVSLQQDSCRPMDPEVDGEVIRIPTVHFWDATDPESSVCAPILSRVCNAKLRQDVFHEGGHEIPGAKDRKSLTAAVEAIRKTIGWASLQQ
ncbi:MAG: hypothetical protein M1821_001892 [Bathelium mastoideum]|nr:MAG: hypothetical protein M1821_001892 [Bathelium mastoideum]